uniref:Uncharacterized protein n=1 Tax=viral metagenome TaxID=1070528 RepID=A0A6M3LIA9_9ZZZZ
MCWGKEAALKGLIKEKLFRLSLVDKTFRAMIYPNYPNNVMDKRIDIVLDMALHMGMLIPGEIYQAMFKTLWCGGCPCQGFCKRLERAFKYAEAT